MLSVTQRTVLCHGCMRETVGIAMLSTPRSHCNSTHLTEEMMSFSILVNGGKYGDMNMVAIWILLTRCYQGHPSERILENRRSRLQNTLINRLTSQPSPKTNSSPSSSILIMWQRERRGATEIQGYV